jgi:chitinase
MSQVTQARTATSFAAILLFSCSGARDVASDGTSQQVTNNCSVPQYATKTYAPGDLVQNQGRLYRCKPWPASGWCGLGGAYEPGVGWAWTDAWDAVDTCSGGTGGSGGGGNATGGAPSATGGAPSATGGSSNTPSGKLFVGYYQTWSDAWKANGADTVLAHLPGYVNVVNLSFMQPNASYVAGSLSLGGTGVSVPYDGPTLKDAIAALHRANPNTKIMISVGGATYTGWASFNAQSVAAFVNDFGLDGVDLDYEPSNANCTSTGQKVTCPASDTEYVSVVTSMRAAMPRPKWLSIAAWSVGAYGENQWASAPPTGSVYMGIALAVFKSAASSAALDLVNVMSYDASSAYDARQALAAYQYYFKGSIAMGIEVPPEAWGGHVYTIAEIDALADAVNSSNAAGLMLWSIQKPGSAQQFATEMCSKLGLGNCSTPML